MAFLPNFKPTKNKVFIYQQTPQLFLQNSSIYSGFAWHSPMAAQSSQYAPLSRDPRTEEAFMIML